MATTNEAHERRLRTIEVLLRELAGESWDSESAQAEARAILAIAREAITIDRVREIEIIYPSGDLPSWLRKALGMMMPKLARAVATEVIDGGAAVEQGQMFPGSMTDVVDVGFRVETNVELRLVVEGCDRRTFGPTFALKLINDRRNVSVAFTTLASPGLMVWRIAVPEDAIQAIEGPAAE